MDEKDAALFLARLDWHAQIGFNSYETLPTEAAGRNAWWHLRSIVELLDAAKAIKAMDEFGAVNPLPMNRAVFHRLGPAGGYRG